MTHLEARFAGYTYANFGKNTVRVCCKYCPKVFVIARCQLARPLAGISNILQDHMQRCQIPAVMREQSAPNN